MISQSGAAPASSGKQADSARAGGLAQREPGSLKQADAARSMPSWFRAAAEACTIDSGALGTLALVLCALRNSSACRKHAGHLSSSLTARICHAVALYALSNFSA